MATGSKLAARTVMIFTASLLRTVASALPAKIGRTNVSASTTAQMSLIGWLSIRAATRGMTFLPTAVEAASTWV